MAAAAESVTTWVLAAVTRFRETNRNGLPTRGQQICTTTLTDADIRPTGG
jgi:hypothetical protein